jgi:hypothetical protein
MTEHDELVPVEFTPVEYFHCLTPRSPRARLDGVEATRPATKGL